MSRAGLLIPVFGLAALFFGWECYETWTAPPLPVSAAGGKAAPLPATPASSPGEKAADLSAAVTEIAVRPLFRADRQPFHENAAAVAQRNYEGELGRFTVLGVLFLGGTPKAIVTESGGGRSERYEVGAGGTLDGFTVKEVREDGLLLAADGREFTLPLYAGGPKGSGALRTEAAPRTGSAAQASSPAPSPAGRPAASPQPVPAAPAATRSVPWGAGYRPTLPPAPAANPFPARPMTRRPSVMPSRPQQPQGETP